MKTPVENYEIDEPDVKATLKAIGGKIGLALKDGWGFMLMLFEYGGPAGANFYISSAERDDVVRVIKEWIRRQEGGLVEINPEHETTAKIRQEWGKIVAVLLHKYRDVLPDIVITGADIVALEQAYAGDLATVVADDNATGLHLRLVSGKDARRLAGAKEGGRL